MRALVSSVMFVFAVAPTLAQADESAPAVYVADPLDARTGATAPAFYRAFVIPNGAVRWSEEEAVCGTAVRGGMPCSTVDLATGDVTTSEIVQNAGHCACVDKGTRASVLQPLTAATAFANVAYDSDRVTAVNWPSTYTACKRGMIAGAPCSTTALTAGSAVMGITRKLGALCACQ
ncbi:hypothetical protein AKJ09_03775 [Labilithrix luteola]|uniref:Secreted protein n=1 Tax=Labilithrix luteola TaxID=1391654 RepID=A0A0K1PUQ5_9BACT|nr:hypothetical protein AKJ09_03775 [Labilithrix luteola]